MENIICKDCAYYKNSKPFNYKTKHGNRYDVFDNISPLMHFCLKSLHYLPKNEDNDCAVIECEGYEAKRLKK
jgi:hypothetical protein